MFRRLALEVLEAQAAAEGGVEERDHDLGDVVGEVEVRALAVGQLLEQRLRRSCSASLAALSSSASRRETSTGTVMEVLMRRHPGGSPAAR